jgi:hypothetical protein
VFAGPFDCPPVIGCVYIPGVDVCVGCVCVGCVCAGCVRVGCVCAGTDVCTGTVVEDTFGRTPVIGRVATFVDGFSAPVAACGCAAAGCLWIVVCAALGAVAAGACLCAAGDGCCLDTVPAFDPLLRFGGFCATIGAAHTPAHKRPSIRIHPTRLIMESSGARRFQLHYDCVAIL